ncbi:hypothetical protein KBC04_05140 [Candidatus Babeliales bacterium]|nr:hypothetical protein [Candidatus Babeliales bacterium]MBP9844130.1 hypothetical protein [Candidatus Babeliales bacterium]
MKNMKLLLGSMLLGISGLVIAAGGTLKVTNRSGYNVKVYVGSRNTNESDAYISYPGMTGASRKSFGDARKDNGAFVSPNVTTSVVYAHGPRVIIVDFFGVDSKVFKTVAFPFGELNSEIYILGGKDPVIGDITPSVAYWNNDAVATLFTMNVKNSTDNRFGSGQPRDTNSDTQPVKLFPTGKLVGDKDGNLTAEQEAAITPKADDIAKVWNYNNMSHAGLMVCMYDTDLKPAVK